MVGSIGIRGGEHFAFDTWLREICDTEESAKVLVFNPYVICEEVVRGPIVARLGGTHEVNHLTSGSEPSTFTGYMRSRSQ